MTSLNDRSPHHAAEPIRPREKLRLLGPSALSDAELLAVLLGSATRSHPIQRVSHDLIRDGGSLAQLLDKSVEELAEQPGLGPAGACRLIAAVEVALRISQQGLRRGSRLDSPAAVYAHWRGRALMLAEERVWVIALDTRHQVLAERCVSIGSLDASVVHPREVFRWAVAQRAAAIILVHNHPSGDPSPSAEDEAVTARIERAGHLLGIELIDHVVVADGGFWSSRDAGCLRETTATMPAPRSQGLHHGGQNHEERA